VYIAAALDLTLYVPAAWAIFLGLAFCGLFVTLATLIGPKRSTAAKNMPFECGSDPIGSPHSRYSVKFYQVAILFLVFDIEAAFMYPWAVLYEDLSHPSLGVVSWLGFGEMLTFIAVLGVALGYVWRKKAIGWV
jgi:NADH-quinone oxidoreductase subunit A